MPALFAIKKLFAPTMVQNSTAIKRKMHLCRA